jgi:hypothetical protein
MLGFELRDSRLLAEAPGNFFFGGTLEKKTNGLAKVGQRLFG